VKEINEICDFLCEKKVREMSTNRQNIVIHNYKNQLKPVFNFGFIGF
jgi:hypothetical protein